MISSCYQDDKNGIILHLKVTANASKNIIEGIIEGANGQQFLKVKVAAIADKGRANKELIKFLSAEFNVSVSNIEIISGETNRHKKILIRDKTFKPIFKF